MDLAKLEKLECTKEEALRLLGENRKEWEPRYAGYAKDIVRNLGNLESKRAQFNQWNPLKVYLNLNNVMRQKSRVSFDVRFLGQTVANLIVDDKNDQILLDIPTKMVMTNERDFGYGNTLDMVPWRSPDAARFRKFFKETKQVERPGNEEHRLESLLLTEFTKGKGDDKALVNIQPVRFSGIRFSMPTPLSASDHQKLSYSKQYGGGIDIFTRIRPAGSRVCLGIIELKDENVKTEPAIDVACQSVAYTVFIRELLRSTSGPDWWRLFGFSNKLPDKLKSVAIHAMPSNENNDYSMAHEVITLDSGGHEDSIVLHHLFFKESNNEILSIESSLSG